MRGKERGRLLAASLVAGAVAAMVVSACSERQRHSVVDFVFDGVPPYASAEERAHLAVEAEAQAKAAGEAEAERGRSQRYKPVKKLARFTHGPFAARECARCHDLGAASGFRGPGGGGATDPTSAADLAQGGRLRMSVLRLCTQCHTEFSRADPANTGLWLHAPVGSGWCVTCHQPHSSFYPHLLHTEPTARLCSQCHLRRDLVAFTPAHRPSDPQEGYPPIAPVGEEPSPQPSADREQESPEVVQVVKDCTRCHDPHRGPNRFILRQERPERKPEGKRGEQLAAAAIFP